MEQQLSVFAAVVEHQSFSRAALALRMTQPAVSQQVQAFEREVGAQLLERSNKFLRLTPAGEIVYEHARQILDLEAQMRRSVDDLTQAASGPLTIGASYTIGEYLLPGVLAPFLAAYPRVVPAVTIANTQRVAELVAERRLDLGLVEGTIESALLDVSPLLEDHLVIVVASGHARNMGRTPGARAQAEPLCAHPLSAETWIVREDGSGTRAVTDSFFTAQRITPAKCLVLGSTQMIKEAVEAGMGISLLSRWTIRKELALGVLAEVPVLGTPCVRQFSAIIRRGRFRTKALDVFTHVLHEQMATLTPEVG